MQLLNITLVGGSPGAGKTTWIQQQLSAARGAGVYLRLEQTASIDSTYLAAEVPGLSVITNECAIEPLAGRPVYIELGFHIDLASIGLLIPGITCQKIAVLPPNLQPSNLQQSEWHSWADQIVEGAPNQVHLQPIELWRSTLTGQVLDGASLDTVWYELINGAYGKVDRAKGIFELVDGRSIHFNFVAGLGESEETELKLPRWLEGRPQRFSGVEIMGESLDRDSIAQTLKDCCLDDRAIDFYQQQIKQSLAEAA